MRHGLFAIVPVALQLISATANASDFKGEFTGVWTVGVPEMSISAGDSFTWYYTYESDGVDGEFDTLFGTLSVFRGDISGITAMDVSPHFASVTIQNGEVIFANIRYQFDDPLNPPTVGLFIITLESFSGFGEGTMTFPPPTPIPEPSASALMTLFVGCLAFLRRSKWNSTRPA